MARLPVILDIVRREQLQRPAVPRPGSRHAPVDQAKPSFWTRCEVGNRNTPLSPPGNPSIFWDTIYKKSAYLIFPSIAL